MKLILRKVDPGHEHTFSVREDIYPYLYNYWHYHPELELTYIRKGSGNRLVGDSTEPFSDGDLILVGSNLPHMWRSDIAYFQPNSTLHIEAIAIHFAEGFLGDKFTSAPLLGPLKDLFVQAKRGIKISGSAAPAIRQKMEELLAASELKRIGLLLQILDMIIDDDKKVLLTSSAFISSHEIGKKDKIDMIVSYTLANFQKPLSIKEVAEAAHLSQHSLCRYFKTRTLKTYGEFLAEIRIGQACKMLIDNKLNIAQICYECGFNNLSNFNRQFKAIMKTTPAAYSRSYRYRVVGA
jgi:AraC-like DNA-binding protein